MTEEGKPEEPADQHDFLYSRTNCMICSNTSETSGNVRIIDDSYSDDHRCQAFIIDKSHDKAWQPQLITVLGRVTK